MTKPLNLSSIEPFAAQSDEPRELTLFSQLIQEDEEPPWMCVVAGHWDFPDGVECV